MVELSQSEKQDLLELLREGAVGDNVKYLKLLQEYARRGIISMEDVFREMDRMRFEAVLN